MSGTGDLPGAQGGRPIVVEWVDVEVGGEGSGGGVMEAYLARPAGTGTWPAVLVGFDCAVGHIASYAATQVPLAALVAADAWHRAMELLATELGPES